MNGKQRTAGRMIIADDLSHVRASIRTMCTLALGVEVVGEASTARELLDLLATTAADIIIVDRDLSGLDDDATMDAVRRLAPRSSIVLCSVFERADGMRACPITPDFTLSKSLGPDHWLEALNRLLRERGPGVINVAVEKSPEMRTAASPPATHNGGTDH